MPNCIRRLRPLFLLSFVLVSVGCETHPPASSIQDDFERVRPGMSKSQVVGMIPGEHKLAKGMHAKGFPGEGLTWNSAEGTTFTVYFKNDRVVTKMINGS